MRHHAPLIEFECQLEIGWKANENWSKFASNPRAAMKLFVLIAMKIKWALATDRVANGQWRNSLNHWTETDLHANVGTHVPITITIRITRIPCWLLYLAFLSRKLKYLNDAFRASLRVRIKTAVTSSHFWLQYRTGKPFGVTDIIMFLSPTSEVHCFIYIQIH